MSRGIPGNVKEFSGRKIKFMESLMNSWEFLIIYQNSANLWQIIEMNGWYADNLQKYIGIHGNHVFLEIPV